MRVQNLEIEEYKIFYKSRSTKNFEIFYFIKVVV